MLRRCETGAESDLYECLVVIALYLSKALDTVRYANVLNKMTNLDIPDNILAGMLLFDDHSHCTR